MKVAVLGAAGGMGSFFVRYFLKEGHKVVGSDARRVLRAPTGLTLAGSNSDAVRGADVVLVAVPISLTASVVREVSRSLKRGSTVVEMTSVKGRMLSELKEISALNQVALLSIHPMFGPLSRSKNPKICVIGDRRDQAKARVLFRGAKTIMLGAEEHDRLMAYTLSLVHILNLAFASTVEAGVGTDEFKRTATPLGLAQLNQSQAVLSQDSLLFSHIQIENPFVPAVISSLISQLEGIRRAVKRNDVAALEKQFSSLADRFDRTDLREALRRIYSTSNSWQ